MNPKFNISCPRERERLYKQVRYFCYEQPGPVFEDGKSTIKVRYKTWREYLTKILTEKDQ